MILPLGIGRIIGSILNTAGLRGGVTVGLRSVDDLESVCS